MSSDSVSLICWYNDTIAVNMTNNPKYVNGIVKSVMVKKIIALHELVEKIYRITKINSSGHQIHLICKCPVSYGNYQAVGISDDDDCHAMLELCSSEHNIELYVKKDNVFHPEPENHGQFTRMLDLDNESTGFISSVYNT